MTDVHVLRVVVRNGLTRDLAVLLVNDPRRVMRRLGQVGGDAVGMAGARTAFHH